MSNQLPDCGRPSPPKTLAAWMGVELGRLPSGWRETLRGVPLMATGDHYSFLLQDRKWILRLHTAKWTDNLRPSKLIHLVESWESGQEMLPVELSTLSLCFDRSLDHSGSDAPKSLTAWIGEEDLHRLGELREKLRDTPWTPADGRFEWVRGPSHWMLRLHLGPTVQQTFTKHPLLEAAKRYLAHDYLNPSVRDLLHACFDDVLTFSKSEKAHEAIRRARAACCHWCSIPPGHVGECVFHDTPQPGSKRWQGMVKRLRDEAVRGKVVDAKYNPEEMLKEAGVIQANYTLNWEGCKIPRTLSEWLYRAGVKNEIPSSWWEALRETPRRGSPGAKFEFALKHGRWWLVIEEPACVSKISCDARLFVDVVRRAANGRERLSWESHLLDLCFDRKPPTLKEWLGDRLRRLGYSLTEALGPWEAVLREAPVAGGRYGRFEWRKIWNHWELHVPAGNEARGPLSAEEIVYATGRNLRGRALEDGLSAFWESTMGCFFTRRPDMPEETKLPKRASVPRLRLRPQPSLKGQPGLPWNGNEEE
jgi:hypothetical protein